MSIDQGRYCVYTLEEKRSIDAGTLSSVWLRDWSTVGSSVSNHGVVVERKRLRPLRTPSFI